MRTFLSLLIASLFSAGVLAATAGPTADQRIGAGLLAGMKGEKQKAWTILFPEAQAGNVVAMFHLGNLMLRSPEYPDNLTRAAKFFKAAADRGHKGSAAMLKQVDGMLARQNSPPTIAGTSGVPVPKDIEAAKQAYARMQSNIGRFVGEQESVKPAATIKVFIGEDISSASDLIEISKIAKARFGEKVSFEYFMIIDQSTWDPKRVFSQASAGLPMTGFRPDMNGVEAKRFGVHSVPAIVMVLETGNTKIISNSKLVITELSAAIR